MSTSEVQGTWFRHYVLALLKEQDLPAEADSQGDIAIYGQTSTGWLRVEGEPMRLHVFAVAAHGVPMTKATLSEVNEINADDELVKVVIFEGAVIVRLQVPAEAVTWDALHAAMSKVLDVADHVGPLLTTVHGGAPRCGWDRGQRPAPTTTGWAA